MSGKHKDKRLFVKILADFVDHPKVVEAIALGGAEAGWLWLCALSWSRRKLTDGKLSPAVVKTLSASFSRRPDVLSSALVASGLWEVTETGFLIHDFADFAPTKDEVEQKRATTRARVAAFREKKQGSDAPSEDDVTRYKRRTPGVHAPENEPCNADVRPMFVPVSEVSEVSEVSDLPQPPRGGESEPAAPNVGESPTEAEMFRAYAAGLSRATGTLANVSRSEANAYALSTIWGTIASPAGQTAAEFLAYLPGRVVEYVENCRARGQNQRFEGGYSPKRFFDWLSAVKDGSDPFPLAPLAPDGSKARQGGKAARESGLVSPYGDPTPAELAALTGRAS